MYALDEGLKALQKTGGGGSMKVTSGKERSNNHVQVNHCVVDCLLCPLLCATQNQEPHREVQSARGS